MLNFFGIRCCIVCALPSRPRGQLQVGYFHLDEYHIVDLCNLATIQLSSLLESIFEVSPKILCRKEIWFWLESVGGLHFIRINLIRQWQALNITQERFEIVVIIWSRRYQQNKTRRCEASHYQPIVLLSIADWHDFGGIQTSLVVGTQSSSVAFWTMLDYSHTYGRLMVSILSAVAILSDWSPKNQVWSSRIFK